MKVSEAIEALCVATRADGRSPRTVQAYREKLGHLVTFLGDVDVESITVHDARRWVADLRDKALSPHTVASRVRHAKRLFNWLVAEGVLSVSPMARIKTPDPDPIDIKAIEPTDLAAMLATCDGGSVDDLRDHAIMLFLIDSGARVQGLAGMVLTDLDLDNRRATVTEKGNKTRLVALTPPTVEALEAWLAVRPKREAPWVFVSFRPKGEHKGRLTERGVSHMLNRRAKQAGVIGAHNPHSFRHRFAINFLTSGGDIGVLSKLMGHTSISVTIRWYGRFVFKELQEQHEKHSLVMEMFGGDGNGKNRK